MIGPLITDLALPRRPSRSVPQFTLEESAAGFMVDAQLSLTGITVDVAAEVGVMQENWP